MRTVAQLFTFLLMVVGTVMAFTAPNAQVFQNKELARLIFFHLPCAMVATAFLVAAPYFAIKYLKTKDPAWDKRALASMEISFLLGILTLVTGMIFADVQWGKPWSWDPRQTSFLLVMLMQGAYFAMRSAFSDPEKQASHSGAYILASTLPELFLVFVFPRIMRGLHPDVVKDGGFDRNYWTVLLIIIAALLLTCIWAFKLRVRAGLLEEAVENSNAELGNRDDSAPTGVVRPVSLPTESR